MTSNSLTLNVMTGSPTPVYRQISEQIRIAIARGRLCQGELLPTPATLAEALVVSPSTVRRAFSDLEEHGICAPDSNGSMRVTDPLRSAIDLPDDDLVSARDIQLRLMSPALIEGRGFAAAVRQGAARIVGGDFHHVSDGASGVVDVIVGDVAGNGVTAGLVAASVESSAPLLGLNLSLRGAMSRMNERLAPLLGSRRFVAMAWARLDLRTNLLELANAGLPDPYLIVPGRTPEAIPLPGTRLPLGSRRRLAHETVTLPFEPGAQLVMITDGITEAVAEDGEPLGCERFEDLLERQSSLSLSTIDRWLGNLVAQVDRHTGHRFDDDWTVLVLRATGHGVRPDSPDDTSESGR